MYGNTKLAKMTIGGSKGGPEGREPPPPNPTR